MAHTAGSTGMEQQDDVPSTAGIAIGADAARVAEEIVRITREATAGLPFGTDPTAFVAALERLADPAERAR